MNSPKKWRRTVLVTGPGRGGTTWLGDILKRAANVAYIFEPLTYTRHQPTSRSASLQTMFQSHDFWMSRPASADEHFARLATVIREHTAELYDHYASAPVDTLVVKQPGIGWVPLLRDAFEPDQIVYVERNPLAILNSYNRSNLYDGWAVEAGFASCWRDVADTWPALLSMLQRAGEDRDLRIVAMACVSHRIAHEWKNSGGFLVESYEKLVIGGVAQACELAERLHLSLSDQVSLMPHFKPHRAQSGFLDTQKNSAERAEAYLRELSPWQLRKAEAYLAAIGFDYPRVEQSAADRFSGSIEYAMRALRRAENAGRARLSSVRKKLRRAMGAGTRH